VECKLAYSTISDIRERNAALLLQRLNFFLITTAFLIAGILATYTSSIPISLSVATYIRPTLMAVAAILSFAFMVINYWNTRILAGIRDYTLELEENDFSHQVPINDRPYHKIEDILRQLHNGVNICQLVLGSISEPCAYTFALCGIRCAWVRRKVREGMAPHTYVIPQLFLILWIIWIILYFTIH